MKTNYVLIDYENVQVNSLALLQSEEFRICVFVGKTNSKLHFDLVNDMQKFGERAQYIKLESSGPNALDFHIAYYLGKLAMFDPNGFFHIISKDTGFDPLIEHLKAQKVFAERSTSIGQMPCFVQAVDAAKVAQKPVSQETKAASSTKAKALSTDPATLLRERVQLVLKDLLARKSARPAKMKTLLNTIHGRIGKNSPLAEAEAVRDQLVSSKYISVDGLKVVYKLPKAA